MEAIDPACTSIPNPLTSLAWLPPDVASQFEAIRFFFAAVLGVRRVNHIEALSALIMILIPRRGYGM